MTFGLKKLLELALERVIFRFEKGVWYSIVFLYLTPFHYLKKESCMHFQASSTGT